jgi:hypothetical protein
MHEFATREFRDGCLKPMELFCVRHLSKREFPTSALIFPQNVLAIALWDQPQVALSIDK